VALTVTQLNKQLKAELKNIYLFYGEEQFLHKTYVDKLKNMVLEGPLAEFNYTVFDGKAADFDAFTAELNTYPQMADRKLLVLRETPFLTAADYQKVMQKILADIPPYAVVVFVEPDIKKVKKDLLKLIDAKGASADFAKQSAADLRSWVNRTFSAYGKRMKIEDMERLIGICDRSLTRLKTECEKLAAAAGDSEVIAGRLIDELVQIPLEFKIYAMSDKLLAKDADGAYTMLREFKIAKEQPTVIISLIYSHVAGLYMFSWLNADAERFLPPNRRFLASKYSRDCRRYSGDKFREIMKLCAEYDDGIKGGKIDGWTALELVMSGFFAKSNRSFC